MPDHLLRMKGISKEFPGVKALDGVTVEVAEGTVHGIVGENGAGKSTLMKILSGVYPHGKYGGAIELDGTEARFRGIRQSEAAGIAIIHQELALVGELSAAENLFLGNERATKGVISWGETNRRAAELLSRVGLDIDPGVLVDDLGVGRQQLVEIAKALAKDVRLLILDEPTAALNEIESQKLLELLRGLRNEGVTCLLISHKLDEIRDVCDAVTVIRDGRTIETLHGGEITNPRMIASMVGRELADLYPPRTHEKRDVVLRVDDWTVADPHDLSKNAIDGASITVHGGEVVGLAGLMGAGRTEFAMSLFGRSWGRYRSGTVAVDGEPVTMKSPQAAIAAGLAYVTEDRKNLGLHLDYSIRENFSLANLSRILRGRLVSPGLQASHAETLKEQLGVVAASVEQPVGNLSGGNQQKVVLGKWIFTEPKVLILDEPTRGVDVGAKYEIYELVFSLAAQGMAILVISSELPEVLGISDRVYAMSAGRITGEVPIAEASQERLMTLMTNDSTEKARA
ncbi:ATP-binding cassette domain-containing protein [Salininema proteolyticum]|uniref:ATP-binding cassette domain-containing protein n=1 Tax=Salininema proteolyticum TaxID=1607685 RepID=A0ABV8TYM0_9ACTN